MQILLRYSAPFIVTATTITNRYSQGNKNGT